MKTKIILIAALLVSDCFLQSCKNKNDSTGKNEMDHAMSDSSHSNSMNTNNMAMDKGMMKSMDNMKNMKMSGDIDADFASMMILHHQSAIDMSEEEIANGKDADAKAMAKKMITMQKDEIASLQKFTSTDETSSDNDSNELSKAMENMMGEMNTLEMMGDADKDFVMMMIPHHEGAKTMAEYQIKHGKNAELKKMAQKMITDQEKEIAELKAWQSSRK